MGMSEQDTYWMRRALHWAEYAAMRNEVPVGAILIAEDKIIGEGWNQPIVRQDPTAHAEIVALRAGAKIRNNYRVVNSTLYVTLEPCLMCVGALLHARIERVVFGAADPKTGAIVSITHALDDLPANHKIKYTGGVLALECGDLLKQFFQARR
jgi:tRNA(adenine34) deaminase